MRYTTPNNMFTTKNLLILIGRQALVALGAVGIASIAVFFLAREIEEISGVIAQSRRVAAELESRTELFASLKRDDEFIGTNDTLIEHAFVPSDNILEFVSALESLTLKNSTAQNFRFDSPAKEQSLASSFPLASISYTNTLAANSYTLSNYLKDFERLPYFTKIDSLSVSSQDPAGLRGASSASFHATLYARE